MADANVLCLFRNSLNQMPTHLEPIEIPTKRQLLTDRLLTLAKQLGPAAQLPSFREMRRLFDVSTTTLDNALQDLEQRRVVTRHHGKGIYVSPALGQRTVAVVLGADVFAEPFSPYWRLLLHAAREQLNRAGRRFHAYLDLPCGSEAFAAHDQLKEDLAMHRLDGILLIASRNVEEEESLRSSGLPVVVLPARPQATWTVSPAPIHMDGLRALARQGCRRIASMGYCQHVKSESCDLLRELGLPCGDDLFWIPWHDGVPFTTFEEFAHRTVTREWAPGKTPPDGLLIYDDTITRAALSALEPRGIKVGHDLQIATSANRGSPVLAPFESVLTLLEQDPEALARAALAMLDVFMAGHVPPQRIEYVGIQVRVGAAVNAQSKRKECAQ